nr:hypothetical protein [Tanacetum cinerariifolium]
MYGDHLDMCQGKVFKSEVELQLGKKIKALRSDRGGEYLSQEFKGYLSKNGIVQHLTSPYTPQENGDYSLESVVRILNMVPTKKVNKTLYEIWHGKVIVARYGNFLKKYLISQKFSRRDNDLEDDHMDTLPFENTSEILVESESLGSPPELIPVRRSERTTRAPNRLCLNIEVEDDEVGDLKEPAIYKDAMLDPDKKTNMDGKVNNYKACLVAKGCTQTYGVDYEVTFSPIAYIQAIKILIAIAAYYDYEIWQMDVKTAFLNGRLDDDIYMEQPEGMGFVRNTFVTLLLAKIIIEMIVPFAF